MSEGVLKDLLVRVRACTICQDHLPEGPRPVVICRPTAKLLIVGQAPGIRVHRTGIPWNDPSGDRLREWMDVSRDVFYQHTAIAIMPMGFCYPGKGKSGDLPPRPECAAAWHQLLLAEMPLIETTLVIGQYSQRHYLPTGTGGSVTKTVQQWAQYAPNHFPLPHPSPRNNLWLRKNPWFEEETVPALRRRVRRLLKMS